MAGFPLLDGLQVVKIFQCHGREVFRQRSSHIIMVRDGHQATLSTNHRPVARGTLRSLIRDAGLAVDEFTADL